MIEDKEFLEKQENIYWQSFFLDKKWYRKLFGGKWRLIKFGKDTPYIGMFCAWSKMGDECWEGYFEVLDIEEYPITSVDSKWKLFKQFVYEYCNIGHRRKISKR